jgi:hypothetical protein
MPLKLAMQEIMQLSSECNACQAATCNQETS